MDCLRFRADKQRVRTGGNNALPTWRGAEVEAQYDGRGALADIALSEKLLISRMSATVAMRHLAHGGIACARQFVAFPKPVEQAAGISPRFPSDAPIARARRGATSGGAK